MTNFTLIKSKIAASRPFNPPPSFSRKFRMIADNMNVCFLILHIAITHSRGIFGDILIPI